MSQLVYFVPRSPCRLSHGIPLPLLLFPSNFGPVPRPDCFVQLTSSWATKVSNSVTLKKLVTGIQEMALLLPAPVLLLNCSITLTTSVSQSFRIFLLVKYRIPTYYSLVIALINTTMSIFQAPASSLSICSVTYCIYPRSNFVLGEGRSSSCIPSDTETGGVRQLSYCKESQALARRGEEVYK
jgi:hypothetical protein